MTKADSCIAQNGVFILGLVEVLIILCFDKLGPSWVQFNLGCDQTKECGYFVNAIELMLS